jgi:cytochrome c-type biogenesis protein CcmH
MVFWIVAAVLALCVGLLLVLALIRQQAAEASAAAKDVVVYRDQLAEVDRDLARGVIGAEEAERVRVEVSRRLLAADKAAEGDRSEAAPRVATLAAAGLSVLVVVGGGIGIYFGIGAPGYPDLPLQNRIAAAEAERANRPGQLEVEASLPPGSRIELPPAGEEFTALMQRLRGLVAERPDDLQGHQLLAQNEARLGNFGAAYAAMERVIELKGDAASAQDYVDLADMMILAAGGYVSPEAEAALRAALERDARNGAARYYTGLMLAQTGRPDLAFQLWEQLLQEGPPGAPWIPPIRAQIEDGGRRCRRALRAAAEAPPDRGPTAEDIEAAQEMTPEERMQMIRGMVEGLSDRLANEGGTAEDWARLIGALGVLGDTDQARAIWAEAQTVFAEAPEALDTLRAAAERAGVAE